MKSIGQDLERSSEFEDVELVVQGEQDIDRFSVRHCRRLRGHLGQLLYWIGVKRAVKGGNFVVCQLRYTEQPVSMSGAIKPMRYRLQP